MVPRPGTISPWSSKATDIVHNCGLEKVVRVERGIVYTLGVVFYALEKIPYNHAVWHLFVLGGSACHFAAILLHSTGVPSS